VKVTPGTGATRIVITLGKPCRQVVPPKRAVAPKRATVVPKTHETPPAEAAPPAVAPATPVAREASVSPAPPSPPSSRPRVAPKPRPAPPALRPSLDPLAASTKVAELVATASVPPAGEAQYGVMLALLLGMLGAAAVWSYGGVRRYRFWRWR
jgi:ribonuclease E